MNFIELKHSSFGNIPKAGENELKKFHKDNSPQFTAPEFRAITLVQLRIKDIVDEVNVSKQEIKESYDDRIEEFKTPEIRKIQQILVSNKNKIDEIYKEIKGGGEFIKTAKNLANLNPQVLEIGTLARNQLPIKKIGDAAFSLVENVISKPIKSPLGWHILRVTKIKPAKQKLLPEVSDKLKKLIAEEKAVEALYNLSNKFEDELGSGSTIEEAAKRLDFKIRKIPALSANGYDMANKKLPDLNPKIIEVAFNIQQDQDSALTDFGDTGYFILRVNGITPPMLMPFEKIRNQIQNAWRSDQQSIAAEKKVALIINRIKGGAKLSKIAIELKTKVQQSPKLLRTGAGLTEQLPGQLISALFSAKNNDTFSASSNNSSFIAQIRTIKIANVDINKKGYKIFEEQIQENIKNDMSTQYAAALRKRLGVTINKPAVESSF
jgi:peptidyl-prolyl cis-trans isomerase D